MKTIKEMLTKILAQLSSIKAADGTELYYDDEELSVGSEVRDADGNPIPDGEYEVEGKIYTVAEGKVSDIKDKPEEDTEPEEKPEEKPEELEEETEPEPQPEPQAEEKTDIELLQEQVDTLKEALTALNDRIAAIENKPVEEPIAEQFSRLHESRVEGGRKLTAMCEAIKEARNK